MVKKLLSQSAFWILNKEITRFLDSLEASLILSLLCDMHMMHPDKEMVFLRQEDIEKETGLSYHKTSKAMDLLESKGLIFRVRESGTIQPKMMYRVIEDKLTEVYRLNSSTSISQKDGGHNNNNIINNKDIKNKEINNNIEYMNSIVDNEDISEEELSIIPDDLLSKELKLRKAQLLFQ